MLLSIDGADPPGLMAVHCVVSVWSNAPPSGWPPTRPVLIALGAALGLHVLLLIGGLHGAPSTRYENEMRPHPAPHLVWHWVLPSQSASTAPASTAQQERSLPSAATRSSRIAPPASNVQSAAPAMQALARTRGETATFTAPSNDSESAVHAPSGAAADAVATNGELDLRLPAPSLRGVSAPSLRSQALNDVRSNTRSPHLEERIAAATTGHDGLQVEDRGMGRKRVRMNGRCVEAHPARVAQIDPMNEVSARAMPGLKPCD